MDDEQKLKSLELPTDAEALRRYEMRRRILRALIVILSVIVVVGMVYGAVTQAPAPGEVTVTLEVRYSAVGNPFAYFVQVPEGSSLKDALLASGMVTGVDSENGFIVQTVGDIQLNPDKGESWRITRHEETLTTTPEDTLIQEDSHFELVLTPLPDKAYDILNK